MKGRTGIQNPNALKTLRCQVLLNTQSNLDIEKQLVKMNKKDTRNIDLDALLKTLSLKHKLTVTVPKLKNDIIDDWTKHELSWKNIDPYSSLKDEKSTETSESEAAVPDPDEGLYFSRIGGHCLRTRKCTYGHEC